MVTGERMHSGLTDLRVTDAGHRQAGDLRPAQALRRSIRSRSFARSCDGRRGVRPPLAADCYPWHMQRRDAHSERGGRLAYPAGFDHVTGTTPVR